MSKSLPKELINDYVDDQLNETERQRVEAHLRQHEGDAEAVRQLRQLRTQLRKSRRYKLDDQFSQRVLTAIEQQPVTVRENQVSNESASASESSLNPIAAKPSADASNAHRMDWRTAAIAIASLAAMLLLALIVVQKPPQQPVATSQTTKSLPESATQADRNEVESNKATLDAPRQSSPEEKTDGIAASNESEQFTRRNDASTAAMEMEAKPSGILKKGEGVVGLDFATRDAKSLSGDDDVVGKSDAKGFANSNRFGDGVDDRDENKQSDSKRARRQAIEKNRFAEKGATQSASPNSDSKVAAVPMHPAEGSEITNGREESRQASSTDSARPLESKLADAKAKSSRGSRGGGGAGWNGESDTRKASKDATNQSADVALKENAKSFAGKSESSAPLDVVIVSTKLTADGLAAINEFSVAQASDSSNGGTFFNQSPRNLEGEDKQDVDQGVGHDNQTRRTLMFNVAATDAELEELLIKIGGQSIVRGQVPVNQSADVGLSLGDGIKQQNTAQSDIESRDDDRGAGMSEGGGVGGGNQKQSDSPNESSSKQAEESKDKRADVDESESKSEGPVVESVPVAQPPNRLARSKNERRQFVLVIQFLPPEPVAQPQKAGNESVGEKEGSAKEDSKSEATSGSSTESMKRTKKSSKRP